MSTTPPLPDATPPALTADGDLVPSTTECLGIHSGAPFTASLGDGNTPQPQIAELRESFGNAMFGSCIEQLLGGNHLRYLLLS